MINHHELRQRSKKQNESGLILGVCLILAVILLLIKGCSTPAMAASVRGEIPTEKAILAVIGEAEDQGYGGMLAVSGALRNRARIMKNPLKGVYGLQSKRVREKLYSQKIYDLACRAWFASYYQDITNGATHWENVLAYGKPVWVDGMVLTVIIGDHSFYKEEK